MDEESFNRLVRGSVAAYSQVSETLQALRSEGRIELRDFSAILRGHIQLLDRMVDYDLKSLDQWVVPLRESLTLWDRFWRGFGRVDVPAPSLSRPARCIRR